MVVDSKSARAREVSKMHVLAEIAAGYLIYCIIAIVVFSVLIGWAIYRKEDDQ